MEKEVVTYEIAIKLKELGFNEECILYYTNDKLISEDEFLYHIRNGSPLTYNCNEKSCQTDWLNWGGMSIIPTSAPLWQQVINFFMEKHNLCIFTIKYDNEEFYSTILNKWESSKFKSYEVAREQAILKAIELCQK